MPTIQISTALEDLKTIQLAERLLLDQIDKFCSTQDQGPFRLDIEREIETILKAGGLDMEYMHIVSITPAGVNIVVDGPGNLEALFKAACPDTLVTPFRNGIHLSGYVPTTMDRSAWILSGEANAKRQEIVDWGAKHSIEILRACGYDDVPIFPTLRDTGEH